jgi:hypothetical protein
MLQINVNTYLNKVLSFLIIIIASYLFWIFVDVGNFISPKIYSSSDMSQYYLYYTEINDNLNLSEFISVHDNDRAYFAFTYFLSKLGVSFEFFLFCLIFLFYFITYRLFCEITLSNRVIYLICIILFSSFWMQSLLLVTLRQGFAYLIIVYFLFNKEKIGLFKKIILILFAANIHGSVIMFIPYILIENKALKNIKFIEILFIFFLLGYFLDIPMSYASNINNLFTYLDIESRSLMFFEQKDTTYKLGFSLYKFLAFIIPLIAFKLANYKKTHFHIIMKRIYFYYLYTIMLGMFLSGLIFHDRIFIYGWAITPIFLVYAISSYSRIISLMNVVIKQFKIN